MSHGLFNQLRSSPLRKENWGNQPKANSGGDHTIGMQKGSGPRRTNQVSVNFHYVQLMWPLAKSTRKINDLLKKKKSSPNTLQPHSMCGFLPSSPFLFIQVLNCLRKGPDQLEPEMVNFRQTDIYHVSPLKHTRRGSTCDLGGGGWRICDI